jgi:hypothetical protein
LISNGTKNSKEKGEQSKKIRDKNIKIDSAKNNKRGDNHVYQYKY